MKTQEQTPVPSIPSESTIDEQTKRWKTYTNSEYNFSFKYPLNFEISLVGSQMEPFFTLEDPIPFGVRLFQDVNRNKVQAPTIGIQFIKTEKTVNQILDQLMSAIAEHREAFEDPESPYHGAEPPKINFIKEVTIGDLQATKVERYRGQGIFSPHHCYKLGY